MLLGNFLQQIQGNTTLMTAFGLASAGIITFWIKDFPKLTIKFIKRKLTTQVTITSQNDIFFDFLKWIEKNYPNNNFRKLKITNGIFGHDKSITSIGYGIHYIKFEKRWYLFELSKEAANQSHRDKEILTITAFSTNKRVFNGLIQSVKNMEKDTSKTEIYRYGDSWEYCKEQNKRNLNSVFIEADKKDKIIKTLDKFINSEEWYIKNGIPYQLGILLYGPPGTGKTSLIKAIASYLNYPIYYLSAQKMYRIENAVSTLRDKCIMVIEDIDANNLTHSRGTPHIQLDRTTKNLISDINESKNEITMKSKHESAEEELMKAFSSASLSEILNSLDGMFSSHGRILVATTNHIEQLDSALIRPGRIDLKVEIGYVTREIAKTFIKNFFPETTLLESDEFKNIKVRDGLSVAELQNKILEGKNEYEIIQFLTQ